MFELITESKPRYIFIYLLFLLLPIFSYAGKSEEIVWRTPNQTKIEKLKLSKQFQYSKEIANTEKSNNWLYDFLTNFRLDWRILRNAVVALFILGIIVAFVLILLRLRVPPVSYSEETNLDLQIVKQEDFDNEIENSIQTSNYRRAIRLLYYKNLRALADQLIIKMEKGKTNHVYIYEISNVILRDNFEETTRIFDYVWYGEFSLNSQSFSLARIHFDNLNKLIANAKS